MQPPEPQPNVPQVSKLWIIATILVVGLVLTYIIWNGIFIANSSGLEPQTDTVTIKELEKELDKSKSLEKVQVLDKIYLQLTVAKKPSGNLGVTVISWSENVFSGAHLQANLSFFNAEGEEVGKPKTILCGVDSAYMLLQGKGKYDSKGRRICDDQQVETQGYLPTINTIKVTYSYDSQDVQERFILNSGKLVCLVAAFLVKDPTKWQESSIKDLACPSRN